MEAKRKNSFELSTDTRILINIIDKILIKEGREMIKNSFQLKHYEPKDQKIWNETFEQYKNLFS